MTTWFITGTDTDIGKTVVGTALARGAHPTPVIALKPIETGVDGRPADADALAAACGRPDLADVHGFVRMRAPLAPWAATMGGEPAIDFDEMVEAIRVQLLPGCEHIIERLQFLNLRNQPAYLVLGIGEAAPIHHVGHRAMTDLAVRRVSAVAQRIDH